jgi:hypothetical protein
VRHKKAHAELGVMLQAHVPRFTGIRVVRATTRRIVSAFAVMIRPSLPATMDDAEVQLVAMMIAAAVQGAVDGALDLSAATLRRPPRPPRPRLSPRVGGEASAPAGSPRGRARRASSQEEGWAGGTTA